MRNKRYTEAAQYLQEAISLDKNYADAWLNLGILNEKNLDDPKRALECYVQYVDLDGPRKEEVQQWIKAISERLSP
jgi:tetratricopeptide (TPR) repeat protein